MRKTIPGTRRRRSTPRLTLGFALVAVILSGCSDLARIFGIDEELGREPWQAVVPLPDMIEEGTGDPFRLLNGTPVYVSNPQFLPHAAALADAVTRTVGIRLPIESGGSAGLPGIHLRLNADGAAGDEAYRLSVDSLQVVISSGSEQGIIWGFQTFRQLAAASANPLRPDIAPVLIEDQPRYAWRGAMLDVARHFFRVDEVTAFIDVLSYYKINRLHLHLTDDQGWRLEIRSWPELARTGGITEVGGTPGGYYTQAEYRALVAYADLRGVTIVPEIEMPGHVHAALTAYPDLGCRDAAPAPYTDLYVGFSTLCFDGDRPYPFVRDVLTEVAAMTTGPYIHIGGDESYVTHEDRYREFIPRVDSIVRSLGKTMIGWEEITKTELSAGAMIQHWTKRENLDPLVERPNPVIMSPATRAYLDAKYNSWTPIGQTWIGEFVDIRKAYEWDPLELAPAGVNVVGVEGPLWTESTRTFDEVEYLAFPRLIGLAEIGWRGSGQDWLRYRERLGAQGWYLDRMGINFYHDSGVHWN